MKPGDHSSHDAGERVGTVMLKFGKLCPTSARPGYCVREPPRLIAATTTELALLDASLAPVWTAEIPHARGAVLMGDGLVILGAGGRLAALDASGKVLWKDTPPAALRALSAGVLPGSSKAGIRVVAGSTSGFVYTFSLSE